MSLSISIFGLGYVGSVSSACLAHLGHRVTAVDVNPDKVEMLEAGKSPIVEARMAELVAENRAACRLHGTTDARAAVHSSELSFICVGTPSLRNGKIDLSHIEKVSREIGSAMKDKAGHHTVVLRSTVLPGTTETVVLPLLENTSGLRAGKDFTLCYNPEFMREGSAVSDFLQPPCTVLGASSPEHVELLRSLYGTLPAAIFETTIRAAEMVKYACNTFHALKIAFANEIGAICKTFEVDSDEVTRIFTADTKLNISPAYLSAGFAFGGSCLPKDLRCLISGAKGNDLSLPLLESVVPSNDEHLMRAVEMTMQTGKKKLAMLGLSFKAATDDLRESPQVRLVKQLLAEGCEIRIWDQNVSLGRLIGSNRRYIEEVIPHIGKLLCANLEDALDGAEAVILGTHEVNSRGLRDQLRAEQVLIDLANFEEFRAPGEPFPYHGLCW